MQRHTMTEIVNHGRSTALERSVNILLKCVCVCGGGGGGQGGGTLIDFRFYMATTLALSSAMVYTRHLYSPLEGFLTLQ